MANLSPIFQISGCNARIHLMSYAISVWTVSANTRKKHSNSDSKELEREEKMERERERESNDKNKILGIIESTKSGAAMKKNICL